MILRYCIGDELQNRRLTRTGRRDDQTARPFPNRRDQINDPGLHLVGVRLQTELLNRVNRYQVLKTRGLNKFFVRHIVDGEDLFELRAGAAVRRLQTPMDKCAFAQQAPPDRIGSHEDVGRFWLEIIFL